LLHLLLFFFMTPPPPTSTLFPYTTLFRSLLVIGYAAYTFALGGLGFWMPTFLERVRAVPAVEATTGLGAILVVTGFLGTFAGGRSEERRVGKECRWGGWAGRGREEEDSV